MGIIDITGQRFGKLVVDGFAYTKNKRAYWNCTCDCGNHCIKMGKYLRNGDTKSCGCYVIENARQLGLNNINRNKYEVLEDGKTVRVYFNNTPNYFLCDLEDWEPIKDDFTWFESEQGYARTDIGDGFGYMFFHSYVLNMFPTEELICDHKNRNRLDNRRKNLRLITVSENNANQKTYKNNKSGHAGVYHHPSSNKWIAYIGYQNKNISLGSYETYEDAVAAREEAELKYFGFLKEKGFASDNQYAEKIS